MADTPWTEEATMRAVQMRTKHGLSSSEIAKALGNGVSREAVCSKLWREKVPKLSKTTSRKQRAPKQVAIPDTLKSWLKEDGGIEFSKLDARSCRWPFAGALDPASETRFCGKTATSGSPYCKKHRNMAWSRTAAQAKVEAQRDGKGAPRICSHDEGTPEGNGVARRKEYASEQAHILPAA